MCFRGFASRISLSKEYGGPKSIRGEALVLYQIQKRVGVSNLTNPDFATWDQLWDGASAIITLFDQNVLVDFEAQDNTLTFVTDGDFFEKVDYRRK